MGELPERRELKAVRRGLSLIKMARNRISIDRATPPAEADA